jgi:hypothetical protein
VFLQLRAGDAVAPLEVVASAIDPGHEKWPGKIKHWPIPSREYKLKLWQMDYDQLESSAKRFEEFIASPTQKDFEKLWKTWLEYDKKATEGFFGPDDPRFQKAAIESFSDLVRSDRARMKDMEQKKP